MTGEPDRVTGEDIRGLRTDTQDLTSAVETFATKEDVEKERSDRNTLVAVVAVVVFLLTVAFATWNARASSLTSDAQRAADQAQAAVDQSNTDRAERSLGSCVQFNINQQNTREAIIRGLVDTFRPLVTPGREAQLDQFAAALRSNVEALLPYRDCSAAGIEAFLKNPPTDPATQPGG